MQIHGSGLTCPNPDHDQSGPLRPRLDLYRHDGLPAGSATPAGRAARPSTSCSLAGDAEDYRARSTSWPPSTPWSRARAGRRASDSREPADRRRPTRWAAWSRRGWTLGAGPSMSCGRCSAGPSRCRRNWWTGFVGSRPVDVSIAWSARAGLQVEPVRRGRVLTCGCGRHVSTLGGRTAGGDVPEGEPRWRSPAGHRSHLFEWEPDYTTVKAPPDHTTTKRRIPQGGLHRGPHPRPATSGARGGGGLGLRQRRGGPGHWLRLPDRFSVVGLPGVWATSLLAEGRRYTFVFDNDDAGRAARERVDGHQLYVPEAAQRPH